MNPRRFTPPAEEVVAEIRRLADRRLSAEELRVYLAAPMSDDERREINELIDWFVRRYPTPADRLAQARRSHRAATWLAPDRRARR